MFFWFGGGWGLGDGGDCCLDFMRWFSVVVVVCFGWFGWFG